MYAMNYKFVTTRKYNNSIRRKNYSKLTLNSIKVLFLKDSMMCNEYLT